MVLVTCAASGIGLATMARSEGVPLADKRNAILAQQVIRQEITPQDVARSFLFLACHHAQAITVPATDRSF